MTARVFYRRAGRLRRADRAQATLGHSRAAEARPNRRRAVCMVRTVDAATAHQCTSGGRHRRRYGRGSRDIVARRLRVARTCGWLAEVATEDGALRVAPAALCCGVVGAAQAAPACARWWGSSTGDERAVESHHRSSAPHCATRYRLQLYYRAAGARTLTHTHRSKGGSLCAKRALRSVLSFNSFLSLT